MAFPIFESCVGPVRAIEHFAGPELKRRVIPRVCAGEIVVAVAMSEPEAGTALTDLVTQGVIEGQHIVLNGTKRWCSGGGHADGYVVYCRLSEAPGAKGIGAVYVERDRPGVSFGKRERLMGFRGIPSADVVFEDARVPAANLIVPAGGFRKLMEAFDLERCGNAVMALGQASGALAEVLAYVQERRQFGKPIVEFQAVQLKLADMAMRVEAARLLILRAASGGDGGGDVGGNGGEDGGGLPSILDSSLAKCFANEIAREVTGDAVQLMGGYGYSKEYAMERRLRDAWGWGIAGGTIDIQKVNIAAALVGRRFDRVSAARRVKRGGRQQRPAFVEPPLLDETHHGAPRHFLGLDAAKRGRVLRLDQGRRAGDHLVQHRRVQGVVLGVLLGLPAERAGLDLEGRAPAHVVETGFDPRGAGLEGAAQIERIVDEALARLVAGRALGGRQEVGVVGLEHPFGESLGAGQGRAANSSTSSGSKMANWLY